MKKLAGGAALASVITTTSAAHAGEAVADLVEEVAPSVVTILAERSLKEVSANGNELRSPDNRSFDEFFRRFGAPENFSDRSNRGAPSLALGSGFILEQDGLIVTNHHVIDDANEITVLLHDGREFDAVVVGQDPQTDLALLSIKAGEPLPFVQLGDSDDIRVGEDVVAVGNPFGLGGTVTTGIISAKGRNIGSGPYAEFLQTDAAINKGNSGGPLFDMEGNVVGVNSAIFSPTGGSVGIGFAVTSNIVDLIVDDLRDDGAVDRGWLGVSIQTMSPEVAAAIGIEDRKGALVSGVVAEGPSDGTIEIGDVIVAFNGEKVSDSNDLPRLVAAAEAGETSNLLVIRDGAEKALKIEVGQHESATLAQPPEETEKASARMLGVTVAPLTETARSDIGLDDDATGVVVTSLAPNGPAARSGLLVGDVIVKFGEEKISTPDTLKKALQKEDGDPALVLLNRRGHQIFVAVELA
ncbi:Do family serine endopeptidase [Tateyamaria sp.]|uniref:Do family serine endopeptidase n=1 Tax=Tateyamaria sp. TaxID=1929288 RepID=UPI00329BD916